MNHLRIVSRKYWQTVFFLFTFGFMSSAWAEDIDIFESSIATTPNSNILIIIDNTANWSASISGQTKFAAEMTALDTIVNGLDATVSVGLMMLTKQGSNNGGYLRKAILPMNPANRNSLSNVITSLNINSDKTAGSAAYGYAMFEAYKYFGGGSDGGAPTESTPNPQSATEYGPEAYLGFGAGDRDVDAFKASPTNEYESPITDACAQNFIILISNGSPPTSSDNGADTLLANVGGDATAISLSSIRSTANLADEYARFLYQTDVSTELGQQNIRTYTLAVYNSPATGQDPNNILLMESVADKGHGLYFAATDAASVSTALDTIFDEIQAVNSAFSSVSLPVSVNVRGTNLNQVYLGLFRPDANALPGWKGNLKQYQLALNNSTGAIYFADALGNNAISATTGFINDSAVSFWSENEALDFWTFSPSGNPISDADAPDGPIVEKGGAAQQLRMDFPSSHVSRNVYTCNSVCQGSVSKQLSSSPFDTSTIISTPANIAAFGAATGTEMEQIIDWLRSEDNEADENSDGFYTDVRAYSHADVLHSRPSVVNYNRFGDDNDVIAYYGSNGGLFRAVQAGQASNGGTELWSYIPEELFGEIKRLRDNNVGISALNRKPYFMDGPVSVYQHDANGDGKLVAADGDLVYLYIGLRRGGRLVLALDVSDPNDPRWLWQADNTTTGFSELGQTWSFMKPIQISAISDPVLIFGGGYDAAVDDADPVVAANTMGRAIFVVNALTGSLIWQAGPSPSGAGYDRTVSDMNYAIPSDMAVIDRDRDGTYDRAYVGDTGGQIWRVDFSHAAPSNWTVNKIATLGFDATSDDNDRRKFLFPPDVLYADDANGDFDALLLGSGDRENPFNGLGTAAFPSSDAVENHYYLLKDRSTGLTYSGSVIELSDLYDTSGNDIQEGNASDQAAAATALLGAKGAYIVLADGEKAISGSVTLNGTTYFNTNQPSNSVSTSCASNLGVARQYRLNFTNLASTVEGSGNATLTSDDRATVHTGGGLLPTPVPIVVKLNGHIKEAVCSGVACEQVDGSALNARYRTYQYEVIDSP
ncbi:MAG: hypothetical protein KUG82_16095 [Pseudomonadales bacterium]|nr:hypothetical protein [Pseudomonadales bacterium]